VRTGLMVLSVFPRLRSAPARCAKIPMAVGRDDGADGDVRQTVKNHEIGGSGLGGLAPGRRGATVAKVFDLAEHQTHWTKVSPDDAQVRRDAADRRAAGCGDVSFLAVFIPELFSKAQPRAFSCPRVAGGFCDGCVRKMIYGHVVTTAIGASNSTGPSG